jgi:hypothetical protein
MPKNIPGIVQRKPRQEAPVAIRIQPPPFPAPEPTPPTPSEPSQAPNYAQYAGPMAPSFSTPPTPMNVEQYAGPVAPSMPPAPVSAEQYAGPMAPSAPPVPGQQQMVPPPQPAAERMPQQSMPAAAPGMPPVQANEASAASANANTPFTRKGVLSSRGFMPSAPAGNNPPTQPPPVRASNPPTPLPLTSLPSAPVNSSMTLRPSSVGGEQRSPLTPARPMAGQQAAQQGQLPQARILIELDGKVTGEVRLQKPALTVGRLSTSDIYIASKRISRQHAQIVAEQGTWVIEDAGSVNGLFYQGSHVKRLVLSHGDHIRLAPDAALIYEVIH